MSQNNQFSKQDLKELTEINIDPNAPIEERINKFLLEIENPYCFLINGTVYRIRFSDNQKSLDECLTSYLSKLVELDE